MPSVREQLLRWTETLSDLTLSADERYRDGIALITAGQHRGAIYLFALAAEMWLKLACFRLLGAKAHDAIGPYARQVRLFMEAQAPGVSRESGHALYYWAEFVVAYRHRHGLSLARGDIGALRHHVQRRLFQDWKIDLRYRPAIVSALAARRVLTDVSWVEAVGKG